MYFKKLEIFGFKSFADKAVLNFEPGITAIVGPNGCGKSNVFDAIRWVLGEQSVKELRGSSMEDVIFNGTDKKPPLGFAEVTLTFSNESRMLPVDYNEVSITRRLFRSGESEYLINKNSVRLKDITEMFMGTGIGAEAYSLIQQGKVDLVVSSKPEDRRAILDEASGITKYKSKRKEATNKLIDTENNLLRINDIVVEVKRQIASSERQANKARRYKEEFEKLKILEVKDANIQILQLKTELEAVNLRVAGLSEEEKTKSVELGQIKEQIVLESHLLEDLEEKINETNSEEIKIDGQIDINRRQVEFNQERISGAIQAQQRLRARKDQIAERCRQEQGRMDEINGQLLSLDEEVKKNREELQAKRECLCAIESLIQQAKESICFEEEKVMGITSKQVHVKNRLTDVMKEVQGALARKRRLELERTKVGGEKEIIEKKTGEIQEKIVIARRKTDELNSALAQKNSNVQELAGQIKEVETRINDLEKKKLFLISQKEFIEKLSVQYEDIPDPVIEGRLFTEQPPLAHHSGLIGKVKKFREVDEFQKRYMNNQQGDTTPLYEIICEAKFIELDPLQISMEIDELSEKIKVAVTQKEGLVGSLQELRKIVEQIGYDIQEQEKIFSVYMAQRGDIDNEFNKIREEMELIRIELDEVTGTLTSLKTNEDSLILQLDSLNQDLNASQMKIQENQTVISSQAKEREETVILIAQLDSEVSSVESKRQGYVNQLNMVRESVARETDELDKIEQENGELEEKKFSYENEIVLLEQKIEGLIDQKQSFTLILSNYEKQKREEELKIGGLQEAVSALNGEIEKVKEEIHRLQFGIQEISYKTKEIRDRLNQSYKIDLDEWNSRTQGESQELQARADAEIASMKFPEQDMQGEELQASIEKLRKRCEAFGSVNLVAIEEYEELRERFEFLTKQQSDLISAKESLHQTIRNINRQTRQMFMDTFTKVTEEFRIYFRMLFGGGDAQLVLTDPENVLESGVDIIARPPGKKLQNISLLSGGEKSLTAIALVFGVFKVNPSPFCVLDEIDAALDESNVGRFSYLLKDFAKVAQFIVITHNKKTIASANVMYGVTMQETGVSKVVSVKLKEVNETEKELAVGV